MASSFISPSSRAPIAPAVACVSGVLTSSTSDAASNSSSCAVVPIQSVGSSLAPRRLTACTPIPNARISRAVATPMPPKPNTPNVRPASILFDLNWLNTPRFSAACSSISRLAAASVIATACSAIIPA